MNGPTWSESLHYTFGLIAVVRLSVFNIKLFTNHIKFVNLHIIQSDNLVHQIQVTIDTGHVLQESTVTYSRYGSYHHRYPR